MSDHLKGPWTVDRVTCDEDEGIDIILDYPTSELGSPIVLATLFFDEDDRPFTKREVIEQGRLMARAPELAEEVARLRAHLKVIVDHWNEFAEESVLGIHLDAASRFLESIEEPMNKDKIGLFKTVEGLEPVDASKLAEYEREMTEEAIPEIIRDVENRRILADESRQRRLNFARRKEMDHEPTIRHAREPGGRPGSTDRQPPGK